MSDTKPKPPRRRRVERNIYTRPDGKFEIGYRDSGGTQRWKVVAGGIMAARAERDSVLGAKGKGKIVQPNPRLRFGEAADRWLAEQVVELRRSTRDGYRNSVEIHLRPRWGRRRLDDITVDDAARLVRELRAEGKAEWTIATIMRAASRVFTFSRRRLRWHGENPFSALESGERPRISSTPRRRIFQGDELPQTLAAAREPWRTLFALAAVTGARESELLGLLVSDVDLSDPNAAEVAFTHQVDRWGERVELKTEESRRTVELPRSMALMLLEHLARSPRSGSGAFLFASRTGRALGQRNAVRALRRAQEEARKPDGLPTFPDLFVRDGLGHLEIDEAGEYALRPRRELERGVVPCFHGYRHTAASEAIAEGDVEEVSWQLGHKSSVVTRTVYRQEVKSAERTARRRAKMESRYGSVLLAAQQTPSGRATPEAEVVSLIRS